MNAAVARLGDGAHGGESERCRGREGADEALKDSARGTGVWGEMDVDVSDKGGCCVGDKEYGDDAAEDDYFVLVSRDTCGISW